MAAWAIAEIEARESSGELVNALLSDQAVSVRETAAWALGELEISATRPGVARALADKEPRVRATAAWALGQMELDRAPAPLVKALRDDDRRVRLSAAWALSEIGDAEAAPAVAEALRQETDDERPQGRGPRADRDRAGVGRDDEGPARFRGRGDARAGGACALRPPRAVALAVAAAPSAPVSLRACPPGHERARSADTRGGGSPAPVLAQSRGLARISRRRAGATPSARALLQCRSRPSRLPSGRRREEHDR